VALFFMGFFGHRTKPPPVHRSPTRLHKALQDLLARLMCSANPARAFWMGGKCRWKSCPGSKGAASRITALGRMMSGMVGMMRIFTGLAICLNYSVHLPPPWPRRVAITAGLLHHSWSRWSMAFFSTAGQPR